MVSWTGAVKLLDFGIAKAATQEAHTQAGTVKGKYAYMSPEQCRSQEVDARADVFALGICLYEVLTGMPLYHRETVLNTMQAIVYDDVPSVRDADPTLPHELERIVQKALQKDPAHRFQSAQEMHDALERFLAMRGEVVDASRLADFLSMIFEEDEKVPLASPSRQTGSFGQLTPSGSFGPFGGAPRQIERVEMKEALPVVPVAVPSGPSPQLSPSAISTARIRPVDLGKPRLPVWAAFGIGLVVAAAVTTLAVMFLL
jgi:serine/threonine protein kinase